MAALNPKQRQYLKGLAHPLKPILHIGKEGLTEALLHAIESAFNSRELIKVKVLDLAPESADESGETIAGRLNGVKLVQVIGKTVVLYRRHPEKPKIQLPGKEPGGSNAVR
ncbi:MAG: ribosome assembly RNA-binding protein YhbY [Blastocatellia bacterium]